MDDIAIRMKEHLFGQDDAVRLVAEQLDIMQAGLQDEDRPPAIFLLYGPTGTGKTKTIETLAQVVHGDYRRYMRVDCGEMQHDHEIARLTGAPPGYLGHRETTPLISQSKLKALTSDKFNFSIILFDEIEKAAPALRRLMLGIMDKGRLRLGDNTMVIFDRTLLFMTSNLGPHLLVNAKESENVANAASKLQQVAGGDGKKEKVDNKELFKAFFTPEFINRIDCLIQYDALTEKELNQILNVELDYLQARIVNSLGVTEDVRPRPNSFALAVSDAARALLLKEANTGEWGGRQLRRVLQRRVTAHLARLIVSEKYPMGGKIVVGVKGDELVFKQTTATLEDLLKAAVVTAQWRKRIRGQENGD